MKISIVLHYRNSDDVTHKVTLRAPAYELEELSDEDEDEDFFLFLSFFFLSFFFLSFFLSFFFFSFFFFLSFLLFFSWALSPLPGMSGPLFVSLRTDSIGFN